MKVYKYGPLPIGTIEPVTMPFGAHLIHFAAQHGEALWVWAEVNPTGPPQERHLLVVGTGHTKPPGGKHVGSWVSDEYVWHLFDYTEWGVADLIPVLTGRAEA